MCMQGTGADLVIDPDWTAPGHWLISIGVTYALL